MPRKPPDWTKTGTVAGYAKYIREQSGALAVVVIRRDNSVLSVDDRVPAASVPELMEGHLPRLVEDLIAIRAAGREEKRTVARNDLEPLRE